MTQATHTTADAAEATGTHAFLQPLFELGPEATGDWLIILIPAVFLVLKEGVAFVRWMRSGPPDAPATADAELLRTHVDMLQRRLKKAARRGRLWSGVSTVMALGVLVGALFFGEEAADWLLENGRLEQENGVLEQANGALEQELRDVRPVDVRMSGEAYDVRFVKDANREYTVPENPFFVREVEALVAEARGQHPPGALPVLFLTSHASPDGPRTYNVRITADRAALVKDALRQRGLVVGEVTNGPLHASSLEDKVVRVEVGFLQG